MTWRFPALMVAVVLAVSGVVACGGDDDDDNDTGNESDDDVYVPPDDDGDDDDSVDDDADDDDATDDDTADDDAADDDTADDDTADDDSTDDDTTDDDTGDDDDVQIGYDIGDQMPDFTLADNNSEPWTLYDHAGSIVMLDSSAMWCVPCRMDTPNLQDLADSYAANGVVVAQLIAENYHNLTPTDTQIDSWVNKYDLTIPVLIDPGWAVGGPVGNGYIPFYWVMDEDGVIRYKSNYVDDFYDHIDNIIGL
ncbi:MAG: TlpA family protein disulfide reductase [Deltaproteobacteria bacterium]|nr:TlpA family protein disulfide reductase [Deltaproteobacteria bacterium]